MTFANFVRTVYPEFASIFKGKYAPQRELLAIGSTHGNQVRSQYLAKFAFN